MADFHVDKANWNPSDLDEDVQYKQAHLRYSTWRNWGNKNRFWLRQANFKYFFMMQKIKEMLKTKAV